jgi:hypothetical protein
MRRARRLRWFDISVILNQIGWLCKGIKNKQCYLPFWVLKCSLSSTVKQKPGAAKFWFNLEETLSQALEKRNYEYLLIICGSCIYILKLRRFPHCQENLGKQHLMSLECHTQVMSGFFLIQMVSWWLCTKSLLELLPN